MQVTETLNEGLKRAYSITLTAQELTAKVDEKLVQAQPEIEMNGFRKGKVPLPLLKKQFGQRLMGEAMKDIIDGAVSEHFTQSGDRPAAQPDIKMTNENWQEGDDIAVEMSYEALPDIPEVDLSALAFEKMVVEADTTEIDEALQSLAENAANFTPRPSGEAAQAGDQVVLDFTGSVEGEPFDGGTAEDYPLVLGSKSFIPGFEEQLEGVKAGEEKDITVTFPSDYNTKALAGKEAVFSCHIKSVQASAPAEIDDALAKRFNAENLETLRAQITQRLEAEYAGAARTVMKRALLDVLDEKVTFDLPPSMVAAEARQIAHHLWHEANPEAASHETESHDHNHPDITPDSSHEKLAERRVRLGLFLAHLGEQAKIDVTDAEMGQAVLAQARNYPGQERDFFDFVQKNPQMQQQIRAPLFEDKVVDHIFENAQVTEKTVDKQTLKTAVDALDED